MEGLPQGFWETIKLDGKTAARCMRVCKAWHWRILRVPRLMHRISLHHVELDDASRVYEEVGGALESISQPKASEIVVRMMHNEHNVNLFTMNYPTHSTIRLSMRTKTLVPPERFLEWFGWRGEGGAYFKDKRDNSLVLLNNYYAPTIDDDHLESYEKWREAAQMYGITWKLIDFPFRPDIYYDPKLKMRFHRGRCFYVSIQNQNYVAPPMAVLRKQVKRTREFTQEEIAFAKKYKQTFFYLIISNVFMDSLHTYFVDFYFGAAMQ